MSDSIKSAVKNADLSRAATGDDHRDRHAGHRHQCRSAGAQPGRDAEGAESIEEVVVTGFRASLDKALDAKQETRSARST